MMLELETPRIARGFLMGLSKLISPKKKTHR
jgi:hypothetical protein